MSLLGEHTNGVIDIHSGGEDNIFPHHECEIAQSCAATGAEHFVVGMRGEAQGSSLGERCGENLDRGHRESGRVGSDLEGRLPLRAVDQTMQVNVPGRSSESEVRG